VRTAGTRISNEEYEALKDYAKGKGSNINAILGKLVREITGGSIEPKPMDSGSKIPYCPHCGFLMYYYFVRSEMVCPKCGYYFEIEVPQWQRGEPIKI